MNPVETMMSLSDMWGESAKAFLALHQSMLGHEAATTRDASPEPVTAGGTEADRLDIDQRDFSRSFADALELSAALTKPFATGQAEDLEGSGSDLLRTILDPNSWFRALGATEESLSVGVPGRGASRADRGEMERRLAAVSTAWETLRSRELDHKRVLLDAWNTAASEFSRLSGEMTTTGGAPDGWRKAVKLWVARSNAVLLDTQRSDRFLRTQSELLKASTDLRLAQRDLGELYTEGVGSPTRAEIDELHKAMTELRREVRALTRARRKPAVSKARASA